MKNISPYLLILFCMLYSFNTAAQLSAPAIRWQKCLGGTLAEKSNAIIKTLDGGFVLAGISQSNDGDFIDNRSKEDYAIIRTDSLGNIIWTRNYGGDNRDIATAVRAVKSGGFIVAGYSNSLGGDVLSNHSSTSDATDYWLIKLYDNGRLDWQKSFGGSNYEYAYGIDVTQDDGYIVVGMSSSSDGDVVGDHGNGDCWLLKLDKYGALQWQKSMGGNNPDVGRAVKNTPDGGYIVAGFSFSGNGDVRADNHAGNMWIVKLAADGAEQWQTSIGGSLTDYAYDIEPTSDGGYVITGSVHSNNGDISGNHGKSDCVVAKVNSQGQKQWVRCFGGAMDDVGQSIKETADAGFIIAGYTKSTDGDITAAHGAADGWLIKLDKQGNLEWQKAMGGSSDDELNGVIAHSDGSFTVAGAAQSNDFDVQNNHSAAADSWLVKINCQQVLPAISIRAVANPVCKGYETSFTASVVYAGDAPVYQWQKNGVTVGANAATYSTSDLQDGDIISCHLISNYPCTSQPKVNSDSIRMQVKATDSAALPVISIVANNDQVCEGTAVLFNASAVNAGSSASFIWRINDEVQGTTGPSISINSLQPNDCVSAVLPFSNGCVDSIFSNSISPKIIPAALVQCMPDTTVESGTNTRLYASVTTDAIDFTWTLLPATFISNEQTPVIPMNQTGTYQLAVTNTKGCISTDAVVIHVIESLQIPNAFSPNADGINDTWIIRGFDPLTNYRISIFDRYGKTVQELKAGSPPWDGTAFGRPLPTGVYYYLIRVNNMEIIKGSITILR